MHLPSKKGTFTIGIFGSNGKTSTANMLYCMFSQADIPVDIISGEKNVIHKRNLPNAEQNKLLKKVDNNGIIIIEIDDELLRSKKISQYSFDVLVHCRISEGSYESTDEGIANINSFINSDRRVKTIILNTDDANWKNIIIDLENTYLITYGLGNKATVTASSIECNREVCFLYCLQRSLTGFDNKTIEPMEVPVTIKASGQYNVYNGLAAITTALLYGIPHDIVITSLNSRINSTGLRVLYENGFGVVDNICDNILSLESGFEAVQNMPYENIYLTFDLCDRNPPGINKKMIDIIGAWSLTLKIKKIYFLNGNHDMSMLDNLCYLKSNLCNITCLDGSLSDIEGIIYSLKDKDMLLFFCSSSFNTLREKIIEILDKRILGNLS